MLPSHFLSLPFHFPLPESFSFLQLDLPSFSFLISSFISSPKNQICSPSLHFLFLLSKFLFPSPSFHSIFLIPFLFPSFLSFTFPFSPLSFILPCIHHLLLSSFFLNRSFHLRLLVLPSSGPSSLESFHFSLFLFPYFLVSFPKFLLSFPLSLFAFCSPLPLSFPPSSSSSLTHSSKLAVIRYRTSQSRYKG